MPSTYTVNLGIEKPATGEQSGTWGDTTNINFDILDQAINGCLSLTLASAGTSGSPNTLAISDGATSDGRNKWIEFVDGGDLGATAYVQLTPNDAEKIVFIRNSLSGSRSVILFQGTYDAARDLEIPAGVDMVVKFSGGGATATTTDVFTKLRATEITTPTLTTDDLTAGTADINDGTVEAVIGGTTPKAGTFTTLTANTNLTINSTTTVDGVIDDDTMATASATKLATSESIKAYVDSSVGAQDTLSEILANGNTSGANNLVIDSGQALTANTINETTAGTGVTIDSVLLKDDSVNASTLEVTNVKANDGTAAGTIANSTGVFTINSFASSSVDIDGGSINDTTVGATTRNSGAFTTLISNDVTRVDAAEFLVTSAAGSTTSKVSIDIDTGNSIARIRSSINGGGTQYPLGFFIANNEAMRIDTSRRVLVGHTDAQTFSLTPKVSLLGSDASSSAYQVGRFQNGAFASYYQFAKSRATTVGDHVIVQDNDTVGNLRALADDGTNYDAVLGSIEFAVDGTPGANDMPGRIVFSTSADGSDTPTERMRIDSNGVVMVGVQSTTLPTPGIDILHNGILAFQDAAGASRNILQFSSGVIKHGAAGGGVTTQTFSTSNVEAMRIDSSQRVLIGLTSDIGTGHKLQLNSDVTIMTFDGTTTGANGVRFIKSRASSPGSNAIVVNGDDVGFLDFRADDGTDYATRTAVITSSVDGVPGANDMPGNLRFFTTPDGGSSVVERMRIDNKGNVQIGTTTVNNTNTDVLTVGKSSSSYDANIVIRQFNNGTAANLFLYANNDTGAAYSRVASHTISGTEHWRIGGIAGSAGQLPFSTSGSERMRLDANGVLMVGKTSSSSTTDGCELRDGQSGFTATFTADASNTSEVISIQHKGTQPTKHIILRDSSGNTKGALGISTETNSTGMFLGFGDTGLSFQAETDNAITPVSANDGVTRSEAISLGANAARFKDLYLSGGIQFDSRSNKLDDYEEGTWNPNVRGGTTAGTYGLLYRAGRYRKIGNLVHCDATFYANSFTGTGDFEVSGLPFTVNSSSPGGLCLVQWNACPFATFSADNQTVIGLMPANNTYIHFRACDRIQNSTHIQLQCYASTIEYLRLSLTYETA